jgi:hypothetical protein
MARSRKSDNLIFVHHKWGEVEIRRADGFSKRPQTPQTPMPRHLHHTAQDLSSFCQCSNSKRHGHLKPFGSDSVYLAANLKLYLNQHCHETSSMDSFRAYKEKQQADWAHDGVCIGDFHYATKQKDVVCRCTKPNNHGQGQVCNPEIVELCAEYYLRNSNKVTCSKFQWRLAKAVSSGGKRSDSDSFKYDLQSVQDVLQPSPRSNMAYHRSGSNSSSDIPEEVWVKARPSLWNGRRGLETSCSTPLGTAATHPSPRVSAHPRRQTQYLPLQSARRASVSTVWSTVQRDAASDAPEVVLESSQASLLASRIDSPKSILFRKSILQCKTVKGTLAPHRNHLARSLDLGDILAQPTRECSRDPKRAELPAHKIPIELPDRESLVELPTKLPQSLAIHSPTLRELGVTKSYMDYC